jgi:uracil-DNA glycosylase
VNRLTQPLEALLDRDFGDWQPVLDAWRRSAEGRTLIEAVNRRVAAGATVYPAQVFRAFELTPLAQTKVLILGQDPYHGPGQAEGLAFSVPPGHRIPPSLRNIHKELQRDLELAAPDSGSLLPWARRGALLLNTSLTVEGGLAGSHAQLGWRALTVAVRDVLWTDDAPKVFLLWGSHAQSLLSDPPTAGDDRHRVLSSNHPSPLSALRPPTPFIGCGHFRAARDFLASVGRGGFDWQLVDP